MLMSNVLEPTKSNLRGRPRRASLTLALLACFLCANSWHTYITPRLVRIELAQYVAAPEQQLEAWATTTAE
ncbi:hypothetical protein EDB19DRAFT_1742090 [Suillus lakei]|nr:hypothetical protein EDB19DRAFT_1742090 [Suillus lakei]